MMLKAAQNFLKAALPIGRNKIGIVGGGGARNSGGVFLGQILGHKKGEIPRFARVLSVLALKVHSVLTYSSPMSQNHAKPL